MIKLFTTCFFALCTFLAAQAQTAQHDVALQQLSTPSFHPIHAPLTIAGTILNTGETTLNSFEVFWSDGSQTHSASFSGMELAPGETYDFSHSAPFLTGSAKSHQLQVWVDNPNGTQDANPANNEIITVVSAVTTTPQRRVVIEEGTGTWCGWCPRGFYWMSYMHETYPETFIGIAMHNGDPMTNAAYNSASGFNAYPQAHVNRKSKNISVGGNFVDEYLAVIDDVVPFDISVTATYEEDKPDQLNIHARVEFVTELSGINYRFGGVVVEDGVTGTGSGYNQANFYSSTAANLPLSGFGYDWQALPNPVPASQMVYPDVARSLLGPYTGIAASVPSSVSVGQVIEREFTYFVPASSNVENMRVVVWLVNHSTGEIINAGVGRAAAPVSTREVVASELVSVFPNPFQGQLNLELKLEQAAEVQVQLFNALGQLAGTQSYGTLMGHQMLNFSAPALANGLYTVVLKAGNHISTQRVVLQR
jgi:hypothetical protein